ncbi:hypothetical protein DYI37_18155 [Fulvimarina endophytica]|uniref:Flavin reductase like domain-containing protein n=1 Tax=Fulvimarina endophytica TaxID=2293836 RepID=A0A371WYA6_9HYPH|nr:flavin reductase [Fulvimarina endophytica]RFC61977.1 hypothetical protein DYI37_18155 [Fulvimarina endophytica]
MTDDKKILRNALGSFATGVTIVTTRAPSGVDIGRTANSFSSVSLDPPMILWSLSKTSSSFADYRDAEHFAVHILGADQDDLSGLFAGKKADKFEGLDIERGVGDVPLLKRCAARFECRTVYQYEGGDHIIFVGEIVEFTHWPTPPLVFHGGRYGLVVQHEDEERTTAEREESLSPNDFIYLISRVFYRIREEAVAERRRRGWSGADYAVLQLLGHGDGLSIDEIKRIGRARGDEVGDATIEGLIERGLLRRASDDPNGSVLIYLTAEGRREIVEIVAILKASEAQCLADIPDNEIRILKRLLRGMASAEDIKWPPSPNPRPMALGEQATQ